MPYIYGHDNRLDNVSSSQYRMWREAFDAIVPKGESLTRPLTPEEIPVNVKTYGEIVKGYFKPPYVDFLNSEISTKRFDRYKLSISRDVDDLPLEPDIDWHDDLGITKLLIRYNIFFACASIDITGRSGGITEMYYNGKGQNGNSNWLSTPLHFDDYNNNHLRGDFIFITNPTAGQSSIGYEFSSGVNLHPNLPVSVSVNNVNILNGNSTMNVILKNTIFAITLQSLTLELLGGE